MFCQWIYKLERGIKKIAFSNQNSEQDPSFFLLNLEDILQVKAEDRRFLPRQQNIYRGSPTSTVSTSTNSTGTIFSAIGIKFVLVEFLELAM